MSGRVRGQPAGRAGRVWLQRRVAVARRGAALLDLKLRILGREEQRFALRSQRTGAEWDQACRAAETWLLRGALLSGERAIRLSDDVPAADVSVRWTTTMGVRHPIEATVRRPDRPAGLAVPDNAALVAAVAAYEAALSAGVAHAAATAALRAVQAEVRTTRRRSRALEERWVPRLDAALRELALALEEQEHDDGVRRRWASAHPGVGGAARETP